MFALCGKLEGIIAHVHSHSQQTRVQDGRASPYLERLEAAIAAMSGGVLATLPAGRIDTTVRHAVASRVLAVFVRHVALMRPLGEAAKLGVAQDMAQMELAVQPLAAASELGDVYSELRALRAVLFADLGELFEDGGLGVRVRPSTVRNTHTHTHTHTVAALHLMRVNLVSRSCCTTSCRVRRWSCRRLTSVRGCLRRSTLCGWTWRPLVMAPMTPQPVRTTMRSPRCSCRHCSRRLLRCCGARLRCGNASAAVQTSTPSA